MYLPKVRGALAQRLATSTDCDAQTTVRRALLTLDSDLPPDPELYVEAARHTMTLLDLELAERFVGKGLEVRIYDPIVNPATLVGSNLEFLNSRLPHVSRLLVDRPEAALEGADVAIVSTSDKLTLAALQDADPPLLLDLDGRLDPAHSQDGDNTSPPLSWTAVPDAETYAIVVEDPDAPHAEPVLHWAIWDIPGAVTALPAGVATGAHVEREVAIDVGDVEDALDEIRGNVAFLLELVDRRRRACAGVLFSRGHE